MTNWKLFAKWPLARFLLFQSINSLKFNQNALDIVCDALDIVSDALDIVSDALDIVSDVYAGCPRLLACQKSLHRCRWVKE